MAHMHLDRVLEVVKTTGCTRMAAYDSAGYSIDHVEAKSNGELIEEIEDLVKNTSGTIRLECWQAAPAKVAGVRKADQPVKSERFTFHVRGMLGTVTPPAAPVQRNRTDGNGERIPVIGGDVETAVYVARMGWEVELLRAQLKERDELIDDDDDDDEDDEPEKPVGLWGLSPQESVAFINGLKDWATPFMQRITGAPINGTGAAPAAPALTDTERMLMEAFKRMAAVDPDNATAIAKDLIENYGPGATQAEAATNGHANG